MITPICIIDYDFLIKFILKGKRERKKKGYKLKGKRVWESNSTTLSKCPFFSFEKIIKKSE